VPSLTQYTPELRGLKLLGALGKFISSRARNAYHVLIFRRHWFYHKRVAGGRRSGRSGYLDHMKSRWIERLQQMNSSRGVEKIIDELEGDFKCVDDLSLSSWLLFGVPCSKASLPHG
jgi:hypothetical protein